MNTLLEVQAFLTDGLRADARLCLAASVAWLNPLWSVDEADAFDEDGLLFALQILRDAFPALYVDALERLHGGATYADLDRLICAEMQALGFPLDSLEFMLYGIPMPAYGAVLDDPDFYDLHPDVIPVLVCFGISPEPNLYTVDVPDCAYTAGQIIAADLEQHPDERWRQVGWLMRFLFSCSGNTVVDMDYESLAEVPPLSWDADDIAFAKEIIDEADTILSDVLAGLEFLNEQPDLLDVLQQNVRRIYKAINKRKGKHNGLHIRLAWPHLAGGTERTTEPVA